MSRSGPDSSASGRGSVTVGITGHRARRLAAEADLDLLRSRIREVLRRVREGAGGRELWMLSPLAEGSDRMAAEEALALGFRLYSALPFKTEEYEKDFESRHSREEFRRLLREASEVKQLPGSRDSQEDAESAYAAVGRLVLSQSDLLLAVWDGQPARGEGGTAEVVAAAVKQGLPTVWIRLAPPHSASLLTRGDAEALREHPLEALSF